MHYGKDQAEQKRPPKTLNFEFRDNGRYDKYHDGIYHEREQPQCEYIQG